jgi:hypothetical protein
MLARIALLGLALGLSACAGVADAGALSDEALVRYAAQGFDKRAMMFKHVEIGRHRGTMVVADFPCGDICPDYTIRIIHYDVTPGPACAAAGGVGQVKSIPRGIAVMPQTFCVPAVLADRHP